MSFVLNEKTLLFDSEWSALLAQLFNGMNFKHFEEFVKFSNRFLIPNLTLTLANQISMKHVFRQQRFCESYTFSAVPLNFIFQLHRLKTRIVVTWKLTSIETEKLLTAVSVWLDLTFIYTQCFVYAGKGNTATFKLFSSNLSN